MSHRLLKHLIFTALISSTTAVIAADDLKPISTSPQNYYFKIKAGVVQPTLLEGNTGLNAGSTTFTGGFAIGRIINKFVSMDLEYMRRATSTAQHYNPSDRNIPSKWAVGSDTVMLNFSMNLMDDSKITPYFRAGGGVSINKGYTYTDGDSKSYYPGKTTSKAAWQIGAGITFATNDLFSSEIEYMFINRGIVRTKGYFYTSDSTDMNTDTAKKGHIRDHVITIGVKFKF